MYEVLIGRDAEDRQAFGTNGMFLLGRHYVKMGQTTSLSNDVLMDVARSHVVFVTGKRGSGKSYSLAAMAEGIMSLPLEVKSELSLVMFDTMGIFWSMKYENRRDEQLLRDWGLHYSEVNVKVYSPAGHFEEAKAKGIPVDIPFAIKPSELSINDWCLTFDVPLLSPVGSLIGRIVSHLKSGKANFSIQDILASIQSDERTDEYTKASAENLFSTADSWGLFSRNGILFSELAIPGQVSVIDVSGYASSESRTGVRALVIGLVCQKLFSERMSVRKEEEYREIKQFSRIVAEPEQRKKVPLIWVFVDEAHEFLPREGATASSDALITLLREGRQPGISLVLASQQPGKIHSDVMTQSDVVIAHHITAKIDVDALAALMQSYMREGLDKALQDLPDEKGAAIIFDDTNERLYPIRIRPRITWHGGGSPTVLKKSDKLLEL